MKTLLTLLGLLFLEPVVNSQLPPAHTVIHLFESGNKLIKHKDSLGIISKEDSFIYPLILGTYYLRITSKLWRISKPVKETYILDNKPVEIVRSRYGLIDAKTGAIVFLPEYKSIERISDEQLLVQKDSLTGLLNVNQLTYDLDPVYKTIRVLQNKNIFARKNDTLFLLNNKYLPVTYFTNLVRFEPQPSNPCLFIFRTVAFEGLATCEGEKIFAEDWKEVLDLIAPIIYVRTTDGYFLAYDIYKRKQLLKQRYTSYKVGSKISVYYNNIWSEYDYTGNKLREYRE